MDTQGRFLDGVLNMKGEKFSVKTLASNITIVLLLSKSNEFVDFFLSIGENIICQWFTNGRQAT